MAVAQATQLPAAEAPAVAEEPEEDRMICRTETVVGSRMPQRVCMTQRHREDRTRDSRALAQRLDVQNSNRDRIYAPGAGRGE
ncbi:hypothetical protein [Brevundimonas sp. NIBR11]|uniref:hypothetical protein n=1 Tax=Brevundimonas sp. NIBR11 TaxID=3015999 RepID=UPI0022F01DD6|nr:hypothetical protein [Brevundimonas sp. NIBR11]